MLSNKEKINLLNISIAIAEKEKNAVVSSWDVSQKDHDEYWNAQIVYLTEFKAELELADQL